MAVPVALEPRQQGAWRQAWAIATPVWAAAHLIIWTVALISAGVNGRALPATCRTPFFCTLFNWDSGYFQLIAAAGYSRRPAFFGEYAFFPGYPVTAGRLADLVTGGRPNAQTFAISLWVVALIASLVATVVLVRLALADGGRRVAVLSCLLFSVGPYAVFLVASYSESLYLALALAAWWACRRGIYPAVAVFGSLAAWTRISGLFLACGLLVMYLEQHRWRLRWSVAWLGAPFLAFGGYLLFVALRTGSLSGWFDVQGRLWDRHFTWPWMSAYHQLGRMVHDVPDRRLQAWLEMLLAVVCLGCLGWQLGRREWAAGVYTGLSLAALITSTSFESLARNSLTIFPVFLTLAQAMLAIERPTARRVTIAGALAAGLAICLFNTWQFARGAWAG